jgi:hypothetical protein
MQKINIDMPGPDDQKFRMSVEVDGPVKFTTSDENGNIVQEYEFVDGRIISLEGNHVNTSISWGKSPGPDTKYLICRAEEYIKSARALKLHSGEFATKENRAISRILDALHGDHIHAYMHSAYEMRLSECDFGDAKYARLLYWADINPPCIYLGYVFKRDSMGNVSDSLGDTIIKSIIKAKKDLLRKLREEEENARRNNRGR